MSAAGQSAAGLESYRCSKDRTAYLHRNAWLRNSCTTKPLLLNLLLSSNSPSLFCDQQRTGMRQGISAHFAANITYLKYLVTFSLQGSPSLRFCLAVSTLCREPGLLGAVLCSVQCNAVLCWVPPSVCPLAV